MSTIGLIPTILFEKNPVTYNPPEMLPYDYQVIDGHRCARPVAQLALEGLVRSGVTGAVFIVNHEHLSVVDYFKDGAMFGIPLMYMWQWSPGLVGAILSAYPVIKNRVVVMALPGITEPRHIKTILDAHRTGSEALTMSVAPNAQVDAAGHVISAPGQQMMGVYVWSPVFTEYLMESHISNPKVALEEAITHMASKQLSVRAIKLNYAPFIGSTTAWTKALGFKNPDIVYEPQPVQQIDV